MRVLSIKNYLEISDVVLELDGLVLIYAVFETVVPHRFAVLFQLCRAYAECAVRLDTKHISEAD